MFENCQNGDEILKELFKPRYSTPENYLLSASQKFLEFGDTQYSIEFFLAYQQQQTAKNLIKAIDDVKTKIDKNYEADDRHTSKIIDHLRSLEKNIDHNFSNLGHNIGGLRHQMGGGY